ncbi:MAG: helix-turn-helix domain-containing protein [Actinomycetota bacterium]
MQTLESPEAQARMTILHALSGNDEATWTREHLAQRFGIGSALAGRILAELTGAGLIRRLPGPDDEYTAAGAGY